MLGASVIIFIILAVVFTVGYILGQANYEGYIQKKEKEHEQQQ